MKIAEAILQTSKHQKIGCRLNHSPQSSLGTEKPAERTLPKKSVFEEEVYRRSQDAVVVLARLCGRESAHSSPTALEGLPIAYEVIWARALRFFQQGFKLKASFLRQIGSETLRHGVPLVLRPIPMIVKMFAPPMAPAVRSFRPGAFSVTNEIPAIHFFGNWGAICFLGRIRL